MVVVVMGVSGCGKTSLGAALAGALGLPFFDADDHHPDANRAKMARGEPLDDADREPWLRALNALLRNNAGGCVLACSALKERYREALAAGVGARFVHLALPLAEAERRIAGRGGHFMPPSLARSQFEALEPPKDAIELDATLPPAELLAVALAELEKEGSR